jgi:hypothetical protein
MSRFQVCFPSDETERADTKDGYTAKDRIAATDSPPKTNTKKRFTAKAAKSAKEEEWTGHH